MKWTVRWVRRAEEELARIRLDADDRQSITEAAFTAEELVSESPESVGESRSTNQRIVFVPPLVITFEVRRTDLEVLVLNVRLSARRQ